MKQTAHDRAEAKRYGVFYTPTVLAKLMAKNAIERYELTHRELRNIKILDPACGNGRFLEAALEILLEKSAAWEPDTPREILQKRICEKNLFGIDRDEKALSELRKKLPAVHVTCADALTLDESEREFDVVLGNPPYVSFGVRNTGKLDKSIKALWRERFPYSAEYKISTYALFTELGVCALREGGVLSYLIPDSFLLGRFFGKLRNYLLDETSLEKLYLIREKVFPAVPGCCVVMELMRQKASGNHQVTCAELSKQGTISAPYRILQSEFQNNDLQRFRLFFDDETHRKVLEMEQNAVMTLGDILIVASGLIARRGQHSIVFRGKEAPGENWRRGILSGSAIRVGEAVKWIDSWIHTAPEVIKSGLGKVDYSQKKLFFRQTGDRIVCAVDYTGLYCLNNVHAGVPKIAGCNLEALAAYLNSDEVKFYYQSITLERNRPLAQIDIELLLKIPLSQKVTDAVLSSNDGEKSQSDGKVTDILPKVTEK